jgi:hypothetical protein
MATVMVKSASSYLTLRLTADSFPRLLSISYLDGLSFV